MRKIKKIIFSIVLLLLVLIMNTAYSQVAGISASKIGTFCFGTVPAKDLEFEPSFSFGKTSQTWNSESKLQNKFANGDSIETISGLAFRCTYGLTDKLEIGMSAPADVSGVSWAVKYIVYQNEKSGVAAISGVNMPLGNKVYDKTSNDPHNISSFAGGICVSYKFNEKLFLDFDLQGQRLLINVKDNNHFDLFLNSDIGYYIKEHAQLICGLSYFNNFYHDSYSDNSLLNIHPGISYETGENFLIIISSPIGLYGKNIDQSYGINIAFTMTIR